MKEFEIRPKGTEELLAEARREDMKKFFLDETGQINNKFLCNVSCVSCGSNDTSFAFEKEGFLFRRCSCRTLFISPRPAPERLAQFYSESKFISLFIKEVLEKTKEIRKEKIFIPRAKRLLRLLKKYQIGGQIFIEVGGGNGLFLEILRKEGANFNRFINIEASKDGYNLSKKRGIESIQAMIEDIDFEQKKLSPDVIVSFELIEHIFDPENFLAKCYQALKRGGCFYLTTPNINGYDLLILEKESDNIGGPGHLNYFTPKSLSFLLKKVGFEVLEISTPGLLDVDIVYNKMCSGKKEVVDKIDKFNSYLLDQEEDVKNNFQRFLQKNRLSSNMAILALKQ